MTRQHSLFDVPVEEPITPRRQEQLVRTTDPETSREAAAAVTDTLRAYQERVLQCVPLRPGNATHQHIIDTYRHRFGRGSDSGIRTRVAELVEAHRVADSGQRTTLASGRRAILWWRLS